MRSILIASLCAALAAAPAAIADADGSSDVVAAGARKYVNHNCSGSKIRPREIDLSCQDGRGNLQRLDWKRWGGARARGRGQYLHFRSCFPECSSRPAPVRVTLRRARRCGSEDGRLLYRRVTFRFTDRKPRGLDRTERQRLYCPVPFG